MIAAGSRVRPVLSARGAWAAHEVEHEVEHGSAGETAGERHRVGPLDLDLTPGEWALVLGPSGCGKSTLLRLLQGAIPHALDADAGGEVWHGSALVGDAPLAAAAAHRGFVAQDPATGICLGQVTEEVAFPLENLAWPRPALADRIGEVLREVGAAHLAARDTATLSGGELQRIAVAAALAPRAPVLLVDEPSAMLDGEGIEHVQAVLAAARAAGVAGVLVEHRLDEWVERGGLDSLPARWIALDSTGQVVLDGLAADFSDAQVARLAALGCWLPGEWEERALAGAQPDNVAVDDATNRRGGAADPPQAIVASTGLTDRASGDYPTTRGEGAARSRQGVLAAGGEHTPPRLVAERLGLEPGGGRGRPGNGGTLASDLSFSVHAGVCVALVGANGTGKSTLLACLAGLAEPASGQVRGPRAGLVFQHPELQFVAHSVLGEMLSGTDTEASRQRARAFLDLFGLAGLAARHPHSLSGGEQRRLSLAAMLQVGREFLLADEPTFGLDRAAAVDVLRTLRGESRAGRGVVFATHDARAVLGYADRVLVLARDEWGTTRLRADCDPREFARDPQLVAAAGMTLPQHLESAARTCRNVDALGRFVRGRDSALRALASYAVDTHATPGPAHPTPGPAHPTGSPA
ncbi:ATP-binding cassette domain-containing protein [Micrococcales bacterium 31B]|nr:ATP-binding cassette domain-containing protein [Micrococcales bacterium 31B]